MIVCQEIRERIGELFSCEQMGEYMRIRTPYLYPDGDYIDLFVRTFPDSFTVSDLGETTRWLRMQTVAPRRSPKQKQIIEDACLTHGVEFFRGMLTVRAPLEPSHLVAAISRLSQAALRISDLWFTFRTRVFESVTDEVAEFLFAKEILFDRSEKLVGRSGRSYTIDFHTRTPQRSSLVAVLSTGSRSATTRIVDHVTAAWYELNYLKMGQGPVQFISLFDDTFDVWRPEEFRLMEEFSIVARWSAPDEFHSLIAA